MALRVYATVKTTKPQIRTYEPDVEKPLSTALKERRIALLNDSWIEVRVYDREKLRCGNKIEGPAIVEQYDSTTLIPEGWTAEVDKHLNLILTR